MNEEERSDFSEIYQLFRKKSFYPMKKNKQGTKTEIIQSLLNHSSQRETLRYIGITQEDKDTAVKSLDL